MSSDQDRAIWEGMTPIELRAQKTARVRQMNALQAEIAEIEAIHQNKTTVANAIAEAQRLTDQAADIMAMVNAAIQGVPAEATSDASTGTLPLSDSANGEDN